MSIIGSDIYFPRCEYLAQISGPESFPVIDSKKSEEFNQKHKRSIKTIKNNDLMNGKSECSGSKCVIKVYDDLEFDAVY